MAKKSIDIGQYIHAIPIHFTGKTYHWEIRNKDSDYVLGIVKWNGRWRQYCYFPNGDTVLSVGCMSDIINFVNRCNADHRGGKG